MAPSEVPLYSEWVCSAKDSHHSDLMTPTGKWRDTWGPRSPDHRRWCPCFAALTPACSCSSSSNSDVATPLHRGRDPLWGSLPPYKGVTTPLSSSVVSVLGRTDASVLVLLLLEGLEVCFRLEQLRSHLRLRAHRVRSNHLRKNLICTGARRNLVTCSANQGSQKIQFASHPRRP